MRSATPGTKLAAERASHSIATIRATKPTIARPFTAAWRSGVLIFSVFIRLVKYSMVYFICQASSLRAEDPERAGERELGAGDARLIARVNRGGERRNELLECRRRKALGYTRDARVAGSPVDARAICIVEEADG